MLFTASDFPSITSHIHNWVLFLLWLSSSFFLVGRSEVKWSEVKWLSRVQLFATPWTVACQATWRIRPWDSPGKNTGVGCHFLLQKPGLKGRPSVYTAYLLCIPCLQSLTPIPLLLCKPICLQLLWQEGFLKRRTSAKLRLKTCFFAFIRAPQEEWWTL